MLDELDADALMVIPSSSNMISANKRPKCEHTWVFRNKISIEMNLILARRLKNKKSMTWTRGFHSYVIIFKWNHFKKLASAVNEDKLIPHSRRQCSSTSVELESRRDTANATILADCISIKMAAAAQASARSFFFPCIRRIQYYTTVSSWLKMWRDLWNYAPKTKSRMGFQHPRMRNVQYIVHFQEWTHSASIWLWIENDRLWNKTELFSSFLPFECVDMLLPLDIFSKQLKVD
jgi:hypothetical protein